MSTYNQASFAGGMNLRIDDTRLKSDQYKVAFNVRNRVDTLEPILSSVKDVSIPAGLKQGILTFGNYIICFVAGSAYYRYYNGEGWQKIEGFKMSSEAPRYWFEEVPLATTNYLRQAIIPDAAVTSAPVDSSLGISLNTVAAASQGNLPGLLVQDNINQPLFIYVDVNGFIQVRTTQNYDEWDVNWTTYTIEEDKREYVPIGNAMKFVDGKLYIVSPDGGVILQSVSGRPLDFGINVDTDGYIAGDAYSTAYSVGVGGITALHQLSDGSLYVAAGNANFIVAKNMTPNAPTIFGEYTFIRKFLFNSTCLDDRCIVDSLGDTRFIDLGGIRSFNAIQQLQNEGRNSVFSVTLNGALGDIRQTAGASAAILYDNYELYAIQTIFGNVIAVYDSINEIWVGFDTNQVGGKRIKQFAKIELDIQRLYAITEDDQLYTLYIGPTFDTASVRPVSVCANVLQIEDKPIANALQHQVKPLDFRCVLNGSTEDFTASVTCFVDNRVTVPIQPKVVRYAEPVIPYTGPVDLPDVDTQLSSLYWTFPNAAQGWKTFFLLSWTGGAELTQISVTVKDETPRQPLNTQATTS
jgi:hypothetical protein